MNDGQPGVDEIEPYVAIGPSKELSVSVNKETFDVGFIIFTIIGVIILITIIIVTIVVASRATTLPPPPDASDLNSTPQEVGVNRNFGAAANPRTDVTRNLNFEPHASALTSCHNSPHAVEVDGVCQCVPPFFGPTCQLEKHSSNYFAVGRPHEPTLGITVLDEIQSDGKSFNEHGLVGSCSHTCDQTEGCIGFLYHDPGQCTLLTDKIVVPGNKSIAYSPYIDSTLYLRTSQSLHFQQRVFLASHGSAYPRRYWLTNNTSYYQQVKMRTVYKLPFCPRSIIHYGQYLGIYSLQPFTHDMIPDLISSLRQIPISSQYYLHDTELPLNPPPHWDYKVPLYVAYISKVF